MSRRRAWEKGGARTRSGNVLAFGRVKIDFDTHDVYVDGQPEKLTQLEIDLLKYFSNNPGRVLSRDELLEKVWGMQASPTSRTVDNFIVKLRRKLEEDQKNPRHILTVYGLGYKLVP